MGQILKDLELGPQQVLRLVIKPFMDAWTYDQHRVDRCCVHVIGPNGSLDSFCHHDAMATTEFMIPDSGCEPIPKRLCGKPFNEGSFQLPKRSATQSWAAWTRE